MADAVWGEVYFLGGHISIKANNIKPTNFVGFLVEGILKNALISIIRNEFISGAL
jgi:hypothetical protein